MPNFDGTGPYGRGGGGCGRGMRARGRGGRNTAANSDMPARFQSEARLKQNPDGLNDSGRSKVAPVKPPEHEIQPNNP